MILGWSFHAETNARECADAVGEVGGCPVEVRRNDDEDGWDVWAETSARTWLESFACGFAYARNDGVRMCSTLSVGVAESDKST